MTLAYMYAADMMLAAYYLNIDVPIALIYYLDKVTSFQWCLAC